MKEYKYSGIVYISDSTQMHSKDSLLNLAQEFQDKNIIRGITGYLSYFNHQFLQYIEGSKQAVEELYALINIDQRHSIQFMRRSAPIAQRLFPHWKMRYIDDEELQSFNLETSIKNIINQFQNNSSDEVLCEQRLWRHIEILAKWKTAVDASNVHPFVSR